MTMESIESNIHDQKYLRLLIICYFTASLGALMQISGGYWDVSWHLLEIPETFFTPPHTILYTGVALGLIGSLLGLLLIFSSRRKIMIEKSLLLGLVFLVMGTVSQLLAGPFDFWWHATFGFDPVLLSPPHALLIFGIFFNGLGASIGTARLLSSMDTRKQIASIFQSRSLIQLFLLIALTSLWLSLNSIVYLLTDLEGYVFTFKLDESFINVMEPIVTPVTVMALAFTGTMVLVTTKRILRWSGSMTLIAITSASIAATANLIPRGFFEFIPLFMSFIIPVLIIDFAYRPESTSKMRLIIIAAMIGPFAFSLDGWISVTIWANLNLMLVTLIILTSIAGALAGLSAMKLSNVLSVHGSFTQSMIEPKLKNSYN